MQMTTPLYDSAYLMIVEFIYGNAVLTADQTLVATCLATIAAIGVVAVPFFVVYSIMKFIFGWR